MARPCAIFATPERPLVLAMGRLEQHYLLHQPEQAMALAEEVAALRSAIPGFFQLTTHAFYYALSAAAVYPEASESRKPELLAIMEQQRAYLEKCAHRAPENFSPYHLLVHAELARVRGQRSEAHTLYEEAISAARANGFTSVEAIACEQAFRFQADQSRLPLAIAYLIEALNAYERWGAAGKVHLLAAEQAQFLRSYSGGLGAHPHDRRAHRGTRSTRAPGEGDPSSPIPPGPRDRARGALG